MKAQKSFLQQGFTLIELLIVIALLGALALGLLATVDPFEQLKKGTDTSIRNTTAEIYNAAIRYYASKGEFPWGTDQAASDWPSNAPASMGTMTDDPSGFIVQIISAGELKKDFIQLAGSGNLGKIVLTAPDTTHVNVCFKPDSKAFQNEKNTKYASDGNEITDNTCLSQSPGGTSCLWCIK